MPVATCSRVLENIRYLPKLGSRISTDVSGYRWFGLNSKDWALAVFWAASVAAAAPAVASMSRRVTVIGFPPEVVRSFRSKEMAKPSLSRRRLGWGT
jgi:hypothetical protein